MQSRPTRRTRRYHAPDLKREVVAACQQPGASVAGVALPHGLNANLVRRWMREASQGGGALTVTVAEPAGFVCVEMPTASLSPVAVTVAHPTGTAPLCQQRDSAVAGIRSSRVRSLVARLACRYAAQLDAGAAQPGGPRRGHGQSPGLQPQAMAGADTLHRQRKAAHRQLDREPDPAHRHWAQELVVCGLAAGRPACGHHHESDPVSQAQWPRSARLSARHAATPAYAQGKSDRRVAAASLGARGKLNPAC